jgi:hypothetical protein
LGQLSQTAIEHGTAEVHGCHFRIHKAPKDFSRTGKGAGAQVKNPGRKPPIDGVEQTRTPTHIEAKAQNMIDSVIRGSKLRKMMGKQGGHIKILIHLGTMSICFKFFLTKYNRCIL